ncbi:MAG: hypothetical protein K6347_08375 [Campylobacterales bacterium]
MKAAYLLPFVLAASIEGAQIELVPGWNLVGTPESLSSTTLLGTGDHGWAYTTTGWQVITPDQPSTLQAGQGVWIKRANHAVITLPTSHQLPLQLRVGWNLASPTQEINVTKSFNSDIKVIWKYHAGNWLLYAPAYSLKGYSTFDTLHVGEGAWIYCASTDTKIGSTPIFPVNGTFTSFSQPHTASIDQLYNISLSLDTSRNSYPLTFNLGLNIKKSTGTTLDIVFVEASINSNGTLTQPVSTRILKSNAGGIATRNITSPLSLKDGVLSINTKAVFDYLYEQGYIDSSYTASPGSYEFTIISNNLKFKNDKSSLAIALYGVPFPEGSSEITGSINLF